MAEQQASDWLLPASAEQDLNSLPLLSSPDVFQLPPDFANFESLMPDTGPSSTNLSPQTSGLFAMDDDASRHWAENVANSWSSGSPGVQEFSSIFTHSDSAGSTFHSPITNSDAAFWHNKPHEMLLEQRHRTLPRRRSKYLLRRSANEVRSKPIIIPIGRRMCNHMSNSNCAQPLALQRWQNSPPEEEAASLSAIYNALENDSSNTIQRTSNHLYHDDLSKYRSPPSRTSTDSYKSDSSMRSCNSSHSAASQTKHRVQKKAAPTKSKRKGRNMLAPDRIFKCTFCCDTFKHKHDWARHERSLHLNMEEWVCSPHGGAVVLPLTGRLHCAYCNALDPTPEHLEEHNHSACVKGRTFRRKDHLAQHLRLVHGLETLPLIQDWKVEFAPVTSRCGFCNTTLYTWEERTDHLTTHFREGKTMADWKGDHGFDNSVTARLTNAFPPYLIASQSQTLVPFSATDPASLDQAQQLRTQIDLLTSNPSPAMNAEAQNQHSLSPSDALPFPIQHEVGTVALVDILARHLSKYAREQILAGVLPTDEMFQREARQLLYHDGDDNWNQTPADSEEWLKHLRLQSGLRGGDEG